MTFAHRAPLDALWPARYQGGTNRGQRRPSAIRSIPEEGDRVTSEKRPVLTQGHTLDIDSVTHRYGHLTAVSDVSLGVRAGEIVALLGPSGCGKTTLLRVVAGFVRQSAGSDRIDGKPVDHLP